MNNAVVLARRYADAYLAAYDDQLSPRTMHQFEDARNFLISHSQNIGISLLPTHQKTILLTVLEKWYQHFKLPSSMASLIQLLIASQRITLLPEVCRWIVRRYRDRHTIFSFAVTSAQPMNESQQQRIIQWLHKELAGSIECHFVVDKSLIAGIRITNENYGWEHSIMQQLRQLKFMDY